MPHNTIILIPSRLAATRLPRKPLADINGTSMIIRVAQQAIKSIIPNVAIASGDEEIIKEAQKYGIKAIQTKNLHESGSDRIYEAFTLLKNNEDYKYIINLQGDLPNISPDYITIALETLKKTNADIATLGSKIITEEDKNNPNIVKIVASSIPYEPDALKALYFTRANSPSGVGPLYNHIGIYAYKKETLAKFVTLEASPLELQEKLEQLRALEYNMNIAVSIVDSCPLSIDTKEDLILARKLLI